MRASIELYTEDSSVPCSKAIADCLSLLAPEDSFRVSRTIGPANYFTLESKISGDGTVETIKFPPKDISYERFSSASDIPLLYREGSVLTVAFQFKNAPKLTKLGNEIQEMGGETFNQSRLIFGPSDLVDYVEGDGEDIPTLHAVSQFSFVMSWDMYYGSFPTFAEMFSHSKQLENFKSELEVITGPLTIFTSY